MSRERLSAFTTFVDFLTGMHPHVNFQSIRLYECLFTHATFVRFLTAVLVFMNLQRVCAREEFTFVHHQAHSH